jgi:activator of HSP90 ATPase
MAKTIAQKIVFKNTTPKVLYNLYMDAKQHAMIAGAPVKITAKEGTKFSAHGNYITGKNLQLIKDKRIVQTWRGMDWEKNEEDSILIISLQPTGKDVTLYMTHANVPDKHAGHLKKGWYSNYWNLWKQHLAGKPLTRPKM